MANVSYERVSTAEQNEARQTEMMKQYSIDKTFTDKASGKNTDRPEFQKMMNYLREGDTLYVESISRLSRSVRDLLQTVDKLEKMKVTFVSLKEHIDTSTPQGRFVLVIFGALAELEREQILQRQREGIDLAKKAGKYKGRQRIKVDEFKFRRVCAEWRDGKITATEAQKKLLLRPNTFYRRVKELGL